MNIKKNHRKGKSKTKRLGEKQKPNHSTVKKKNAEETGKKNEMMTDIVEEKDLKKKLEITEEKRKVKQR